MPCLNPSIPHIGLPPSYPSSDAEEVPADEREMAWAEYEIDHCIKKLVARRSRRNRDSLRRELQDDKRHQLRMLSKILDETPAEEVYWIIDCC